MSETPSSMMERYRQIPRAFRWALLAAIGIALFEVREMFLRPVADQWDRSAERIKNQVTEVRASEEVTREINQMRDVVVNLGPVDVPNNEYEGAKALDDTVIQVLQKNNASNPSRGTSHKGNLAKTALTSIANGKRIERLTEDIKFDSTPKAAAAIIAELESNPNIETVESVRLTRDTGGKVKVHLIIEAWVLASATEAPKGEPQ